MSLFFIQNKEEDKETNDLNFSTNSSAVSVDNSEASSVATDESDDSFGKYKYAFHFISFCFVSFRAHISFNSFFYFILNFLFLQRKQP